MAVDICHFRSSDVRENCLRRYLTENGKISKENHADAVEYFDKWLSPMYNEIVNAYTKSWERTVSLQKIALQELSAPLIPVFEKISVMPLVGTIDTERARLIMENLLKWCCEASGRSRAD